MAFVDTRTAPQNPETTSTNSDSTVDADKGKYHLDNRIRTVLDANSTTLERVQAGLSPIGVAKDVAHDIVVATRSALQLNDGKYLDAFSIPPLNDSATGAASAPQARVGEERFRGAFDIPQNTNAAAGTIPEPQSRVVSGHLESSFEVPQIRSLADKRAQVYEAASQLHNRKEELVPMVESGASLDRDPTNPGVTSRVTDNRLQGAFDDPRKDQK